MMFNGMLQMTNGAFESVSTRAEETQIEIKGRVIKARFQCVFEFFRGLRCLVLGLRVDCLTEMQDDFRLLRGLHG